MRIQRVTPNITWNQAHQHLNNKNMGNKMRVGFLGQLLKESCRASSQLRSKEILEKIKQLRISKT